MLTHLKLRNFRRYDELDLQFPTDRQLIAIVGPNGAGKTTILEAITYALWGESRHGRRHLNRMIRRGAEYEGLEVELGFELDGTRYTAHRKLTGRASSAVLYANDNPLCEGASAVTEQMVELFGMDATSFRLSTIAQQNELDGLAGKTDRQRTRMLGRLLRLSAIEKARDDARSDFRSAKDVIDTYGQVPDAEELDDAVTNAEAGEARANLAYRQASRELEHIDEALAADADVETRYQQAKDAKTRADADVNSAERELSRLQDALDRTEVPEVPDAPDGDPDELAEQADTLDRAIAEREAALASRDHLELLRGDHDTAVSQREDIDAWFDEHGTADVHEGRVADCDRAIDQAEDDLVELDNTLAQTNAQQHAAREAVTQLDEQLDGVDTLDGTCPTCHQQVTADHIDSVRAALSRQRDEQQARVDELGEQLDDGRRRRDELRTQMGELRQRRQQAAALLGDAQARDRQRRELDGRIEVLAEQLRDLPEVPDDHGDLYQRRDEVRALLRAHRTYQQQQAAATEQRARYQQLVDQTSQAQQRLADAHEAAQAAELDPDLIADQQRLTDLRGRRARQADMVAEAGQERAVAAERAESARRRRDELGRSLAKLRQQQYRARTHSLAAELLDAAHQRLNGQVRPALEGAVGDLLARMSNGRFSDVQLSDTYELSIHDQVADDDGQPVAGYYPLSEYSGGEGDLIALAMRLAIAGIVAERHGTGGPGFIVLDETFGSQDADRRLAILDAFRTLRSHYGQIILVSHVAGIEASADLVLNVTPAGEQRTAVVDVM